MGQHPDLFIVMIDYGRIGREAVVDPNHNWSDALTRVREAMNDGQTVSYVLHVHDGISEDRSEEAFRSVMTELADDGERITDSQYAWIELHVGSQAANSFRRAA